MKNFYLKFSRVTAYLLTVRHLFILVFVSLLFNQGLHSQCKLNRSKDNFSTGQLVYSNNVTLKSVFPLIGDKKPWDLDMNFRKNGNFLGIQITHESQSSSSAISAIRFRFKDGTVIIRRKPIFSSDYNTGLGYEYTYTVFEITKEELMKFASKNLLIFQAVFEYNPDYPVVEGKIKKRIIKKIKHDASCILSEINSNTKNPKVGIEDSCKYAMDKIDDFTKKRTVLTNPKIIYYPKNQNSQLIKFMNVMGSNIDGANGLQFNRGLIINSSSEVDETALKTLLLFDQVDLLLEDNEIITLKGKEVSQYVKNPTAYFSYKLFTISDDSVWKKLETIPLKKLRLSNNGKVLVTQEIKKQYAKSIMKVTACINKLGISNSKTSTDSNNSERNKILK